MINFKEYLTEKYIGHSVVQEPFNSDKAHEHGNSLHAPAKLTPEEHHAIKQYTSTEYAVINRYHRTGKLPDNLHYNIPDEEKIKDFSGRIDSAIAKHKTTKGIHVYRGITPEDGNSFKKGKRYTDKGFVSTSLDPGTAHFFSTMDFLPGTGHVVHIKVPKGSKALYMNQQNLTSAHEAEHEVLLPRNSKFRYEGSENVEHEDKMATKHDGTHPIIKYTLHHLTHIPEKE
jgi:hypothetical protein